jgi:hypothetical protein
MVHLWLETGELPPDHRNRAALEKRLVLSQTTREAWWSPQGEHEVALAYNVVSGEALECPPDTEKGEWKASFGDEWVTGTLDYAQDLFGEPWVDDLKTGRFVAWDAYKAQQAFYALAWGKVRYGRLMRTRSTLTHWPKYPMHNPPRRFGSVFEVDSLGVFADKLRILRDTVLEVRAGVKSEVEVLSLGEHCRFCPSRSQCPKFGRDDGLHELEGNYAE